MTIKDVIKKYGDTNENWLILEFLTNKKILDLKVLKDFCIDDVYEKFLDILEKRKEHYPLQYIFGKWDFYGLSLYVDKSCLIPRFETEILVDEILNLDCKKEKILDIGSGSGAISIALAYNLKNSNVYGIDISKDAISISNRNKDKFSLENVNFFQSDIFSNVKDKDFDIIVSNPPYIDENDIKTLEKELYFEPQNALYGGKDGLYFYRKIIENANNFLKYNGILAFEIGYNQKDKIIEILKKEKFEILICKKDFSGFDRIIIARKGKKNDFS